jgi:hypothetical protein
MPDHSTTTISLPPIQGPSRRAQEATSNRSHSIHILNNDALLNIFYLYRLDIPDEEDDDDGTTTTYWDRERWWYKLAQVCRQWRYLILASPSQLDLQLVCTYGTPVADMLAHSPPLPLIIFYLDTDIQTTAEDENGILLSLEHRDRVRRIGLSMPASSLQKIIMALDDQFPVLERMYIHSEEDGGLILPKTFQAPLLRHLSLRHAAIPIASPLLMTTTGLVTLLLLTIPSCTYFPPSYILTRLSLMPQLEWLSICFCSPIPNRDVRMQLLGIPTTTHVTLPNLRWFEFNGVSAYLEGLLSRVTAPVLNKLQINFFNQLTFNIPSLLQFLHTSESIVFDTVLLDFQRDSVFWMMHQHGKEGASAFYMTIMCRQLDWQVASTVQILGVPSPALSTVERLTLNCEEHDLLSKWLDGVNRAQWRELLRPFSNLKTLQVQEELVDKISRSLQSEDGESSLELLPSLRELESSGGDKAWHPFTSFINERRAAGHPVIQSRYFPV